MVSVNKTMVIRGSVVKAVILHEWGVAIILRNGKKIVIEPDVYDEIFQCVKDDCDDECVFENLRLRFRGIDW